MSVTAVPLQPLPKGTVLKLWIGIVILVALAVGLAWVGTSRLQIVQLEKGVSYRVFESGTGEPARAQDTVKAHVEQRAPDGTMLASTRQQGQPQELGMSDMPPFLRDLFLQMRKGGAYQVFVPIDELTGGQPLPPEGPLKSGDRIEIRFAVTDVVPDGLAARQRDELMRQQMMQQMMEQQGGAPGGPGGPGGPDGMGPDTAAPGGPGAGPAAGPAPAPRPGR